MDDHYYPLLDTESDTSLEQPDLDQLRHDRLERNRQFLTSMNPGIAAKVLPKADMDRSLGDVAAVCIQRRFRGYLGRKVYVEKLYQRFLEEEEKQNERVRYQMEEGELLVENHQLEVLFDDDRTTRRNAKRLHRSKVITIQRAWRSYLKKVNKSQTSDESQLPGHYSNINHSNSNLETPSEPRSRTSVTSSEYFQTNEGRKSANNVEETNDEQDEYVHNNPLVSAELNQQRFNNQSDDLVPSSSNLSHSAVLKLPDDSNLVRLPKESNEDFFRRQRKTTLLKRAQRFFELNKFDVKHLPVDLDQPVNVIKTEPAMHAVVESAGVVTSLKQACDENSNDKEFHLQGGLSHVIADFHSDTQEIASCKSAAEGVTGDVTMTTHCDSQSDISNSKGGCDFTNPIDNNSMSHDTQSDNCVSQLQTGDVEDERVYQLTKGDNATSCHGKGDNAVQTSAGDNTGSLESGDKSADKIDITNLNSPDKGDNTDSIDKSMDKGDNSNSTEDELCAFDVYNIETAMPDINWESLEEKLALARAEEEERQKARRNDREEIRKKLAMGVDDDYYDDENDDDDDTGDVYKKPTLHSRLQGGMNLQICFMNESPGDTDPESRSPRQHVDPDNVTATDIAKVAGIVDSDNNLQSMPDLNPMKLLPDNLEESGINSKLKATAESKDINFQSKQELLQNEAKLALAQAGSMARMQLEIEKQSQKKSPMAEMVGIPGLGERRRKKLGVRKLQEMNLAQVQVLYNDLQTQIESLNEDLVKLLMERDELHMEQDSMLVDIEDLTRRAEELAEKANSTPSKKSGSPRKSSGSLKGRILGR